MRPPTDDVRRPLVATFGPVVRHSWKAAAVLAVVLGGLWMAAHRVADVTWQAVATVLSGVAPERLLLATVVWFGGLAVYSVVLSSALPGLGLPRGLLLNLSGSAVSNVLPLGGAAGTALNWRMVTKWGHSNSSFVAFCALTNLLDVLTKLVLPLAALMSLATVSHHVPPMLWLVGAGCAGALVLVLGLAAVVRRSHAGRYVGSFGGRLDTIWSSTTRIGELLGQRWFPLIGCSAGYIAAQVLLLDVSLRAVGVHAGLPVVMMATALERLATLLPLTPGGAGVAEVGAIAWLVSCGLSPAGVVAGVVLCRFFLVVLEIPVGGALLAGWGWRHRVGLRAPDRRTV